MLFDSHCHLDVAEFAADRDAVLARARAAGVRDQLVPAVDRAHWPALHALCEQEPGLHPAYGVHPMFLDTQSAADVERLPAWIADHRCVAIGECGLDYFVEGFDRELQHRVFRRQLEIAREAGLPVIVHARRAVDAVIAEVRRVGGLRGVIHSYPGSAEQARQLHDLGFLLGIGGPVTYERAQRLRRLVASMPLEQLLLETDAPDQPDCQHRGQRNEPARLTLVRDTVAALRGESADTIAAATTANARRLFGLPAASATVL
jgi:TatD DNase family protein